MKSKLLATTSRIGLAALAFALVHRPASARAQSTTIDFEEFPSDTVITTQYNELGLGVLFTSDVAIRQVAGAHSGDRVLSAIPSDGEFDPGALGFGFTTAKSAVSFFARTGSGSGVRQGLAQAFDASDNLVAEDGPKDVPSNDFGTNFALQDPLTSIVKVVFAINPAIVEEIDDLTIDGLPPAPLPTTAPIVTINSAVANPDGTAAVVSGTVIGEAIFSTTLTVTSPQQPGHTVPPSQSVLSLQPTGRTNQFTFTGNGPALGLASVTVDAANTAGQHGVAQTTVFVASPAVAAECGPGKPLGDVLFGTSGGGGCLMVQCQRGGVSVEGDASHLISPDVFAKWLTVNDPRLGGGDSLGCPIADVQDVPGGLAVKQEFERGAIYARSNVGAVFYVASVFENAIAALGGNAATGVPTSDPTADVFTFSVPTWMFQRFHRPLDGGAQDSTLEIRGQPAVLYVERAGGDLTDLAASGLALGPTTATLWQSFTCQGDVGPFVCPAAPDTRGTPLTDTAQFCNFQTFPFAVAWGPVIDDHAVSSLVGWIKARSDDRPDEDSGSHMAHGDNPLVHEFYGDPPSFPSDWNLHVRPFPQSWNLLGGSALAHEGMEVEIEEYYANYFFLSLGFPNAGDMVRADGRWIVDCGHDDFNTEIHPPSLWVVTHTDSFDGVPVTRSQIQLNGFYNGDPATVEVVPPPRPTASSSLELIKSTDSAASLNITVATDLQFDRARATFSAPHRNNPVSAFGELEFESGRDYEGVWEVGWLP
jgi:hypothetical protein